MLFVGGSKYHLEKKNNNNKKPKYISLIFFINPRYVTFFFFSFYIYYFPKQQVGGSVRWLLARGFWNGEESKERECSSNSKTFAFCCVLAFAHSLSYGAIFRFFLMEKEQRKKLISQNTGTTIEEQIPLYHQSNNPLFLQFFILSLNILKLLLIVFFFVRKPQLFSPLHLFYCHVCSTR